MQVEPQQRNAHPSEEDQSGSMNLPTSVVERVKRDGFATMLPSPWAVPIEKNLQTRSPISTHGAKFGILTRNKNEKTRVRITM